MCCHLVLLWFVESCGVDMQVVVIPLPPPTLEPPKVAVRIPKKVQERKAAAAAAREAKRLAAGAAVNPFWSASCPQATNAQLSMFSAPTDPCAFHRFI